MATYTLAELITKLRAAIGYSLNVAHAVDQEQAWKLEFQRLQNDLWIMFDWPALKVRRPITVLSQERWVDFPDDVDFEHINDVFRVNAGGSRDRLGYGICEDDLGQIDSDAGQTSFPVRKWETAFDKPGKFEIWPVPNQNTSLVVVGRVALKPLVDDDDTCTLDGDLLVAQLAATLLSRNRSEDAPLAIKKAQELMARHRGRQTSNKTKAFVMGGGGSGSYYDTGTHDDHYWWGVNDANRG